VSTYVGQQYARSPAEFDNESNHLMFSMGQFLHCVVRATANQTPPDVPADCALRDYEHKVFQSRWERPCNLAVQDWQLAHFFQHRTRLVQRDFIKEHVKAVKNAKKLKDSINDEIEASQSEKCPVHPMALEGGLLRVILGMTETEWRFAFQAIHALQLLDLTESATEAADLLSACGHRNKKSASFRSDWSRGSIYLKKHSKHVTRELASQELASVRIAAHRDGVQSVVALLLTDEKDQAVFLQLVGELEKSQRELYSPDPKVEEDNG